MSQFVRPRGVAISALAAAVASMLVGSALAANIAGTARNDSLRGTAKADRLNGQAGNDKLYGLGGNDALTGGPGNDVLVGGAGADNLACGPGRDTALADAQDKLGADCEAIKGLAKPALSVADLVSDEGNGGTNAVQFDVRLAKASPLKATVAFATRDGSASAGSDYVAATGTLSFGPGETKKSISVSIMGDTAFEADETFTVELSAPVNASLGKPTATGTIKNEDVQKPKSGRYNGTTSQNRALSFDVDSNVTRASNIRLTYDLNCKEVPITFANEQLELPVAIPLGPDWRFSFTDSYADSDVGINIRVDGGLAVGGPATGTFRVDVSVNVTGGTVHCSSGDVSWNASAPA